jgi:hypothetical protein
MAASKTVGDGTGGVDVVTMTAIVGTGAMACIGDAGAGGAVGEAASGEDTAAAGTTFWDFVVGEGGDAPTEVVVLQMLVLWGVPGLLQKM